MYFDGYISLVRREVVRAMRKFHNPPRIGLVSSYDKTNHAVKVQYQPEGTLSGWIPLTGLAVGNGYGIASAPNIGDPVEVHHQESDHQAARVLTRHWSHQNKPPQVAAGEHVAIHQSGSTIHWKADGTVIIAGAGYTQTGQNTWRSGTTTTSQGSGATGDTQQPQQPQQPQSQIVITLNPDGHLEISAPKDKITLTSPAIELNGTVYLGGTQQTANRPVSAQGTQTSDGATDTGNFLSKVYGL